MTIGLKEISDVVLKVGSISGLVSLAFTIRNQIQRRSKFKFDFRSHSGSFNTRDNIEFYDIQFDGHIKNQSNEQNSVTAVYYAIWGNRSRTKTLAFGSDAALGDPNHVDQSVSLPMLFEAKEGKRVMIRFAVALTGTHVGELVRAQRQVTESSALTLPRHEFKLAFEDVNETLFDDQGKIKSRKLINLWWTLENTFTALKRGNPFPYLGHMLQILLAYAGWKIRGFFAALGL